jgi:D-alanyl-D-alanine dipeptidase
LTAGIELDMGTPFDYFGIEASHDYPSLSEVVKGNRKLLKAVMTIADFNSFDSEWWHYKFEIRLELGFQM